MIDLHTHVLPGIDDGSKSIEESIKMIKVAKECGFLGLVLTPHYMLYTEYESKYQENRVVLEALKEALEKENIEMYLFLGNEVYYDPVILDQISEKSFVTINDSQYFLVETMRQSTNPLNWETFLFQLQGKGYTPIIAHPERYDFVQENPNLLKELIDHGSLAQVNILSLIGGYGGKSKATAEILLTHNMVHFLSSDAHRVKSYEKFEEAKEAAIDLIGEKKVMKLLDENPKRVLVNMEIPYKEPYYYEDPQKRKKGFSRLWKK